MDFDFRVLASADVALFLDLDGTLLEIAERPDAVIVPPELIRGLERANDILDGALAIISGRKLADIDALVAPLVLDAAGSHGFQQRSGGTVVDRITPELEAAKGSIYQSLLQLVVDDPRLLLETKPGTVALHYRRAPEREEDCWQAISRAAASYPQLRILRGKMVFEARPDGIDKGGAVRSFMQANPFKGRRPIFIGDDTTDEDGFRAAKELGGVGIKVGDGTTAAHLRVRSVADARAIVFAAGTGNSDIAFEIVGA